MRPECECPICRSSHVAGFFRRERVPVQQNLVMEEKDRAVAIARGALDLAVCEECGFVFNRAFDLANLRYTEAYDNTQSCSPFFNHYLDQLARYMIDERAVRNARVVEVGSGKGLFLRKLVEPEDAGNSGHGFDPAYVGPAIDLGGRLKFERRFYDRECADVPADVVVCRHVIEHVPDPVSLLRTIRLALVNSPNARVFFETPCVHWILDKQVIWDFFYEHCSYFTAESLTTAFEVAGFAVESVRRAFGDQYLWLEAVIACEAPTVTRRAGVVPDLARGFAQAERDLRERWGTEIGELAATEKVALWGAGAKGVTFANPVDPERTRISCIVDLNPAKQGHYLPGTGHPIVGMQGLADHGVTVAVLMNPNYHDEIFTLLGKEYPNVRLIAL